MMTGSKGTAIHEPGERQYATLAYLTAEWGLDWRTLRDAAAEARIEPDFTLNGLGYYSMNSVGRLQAHLVNCGLLRCTLHVPAGSVRFDAAAGTSRDDAENE